MDNKIDYSAFDLRECKWCGKEFIRKKIGAQAYCSQECRDHGKVRTFNKLAETARATGFHARKTLVRRRPLPDKAR